MSKYTWRSAGLSDRGLVRKDNQDSFYMSKDGRVFVVADGVGGYSGGAIASRIAVETVDEMWCRAENLSDEGIEQWMRDTANEANRRISSEQEKDPRMHCMGTTILIAVIGRNGMLHFGHAGDSRAVLVRGSELDLVTFDHSVVMEMHLHGQITREQCRTNIYRHLITRCLGHEESVDLDYVVIEPQPGDCFVLASDGLADEMKEEEIGAIVSKCKEPQAVCEKLLENVLKCGARDNTTIVTLVFEGNCAPAQMVEAGD